MSEKVLIGKIAYVLIEMMFAHRITANELKCLMDRAVTLPDEEAEMQAAGFNHIMTILDFYAEAKQ